MKHTMSKLLRNSAISGALLGLGLGIMAMPAQADPIYNVDMNFASGASFTGTLTLSSNYEIIEGVSGTLYGYQPGTIGYVGGTASDPISWIYYPGNNEVSSGGEVSGNFLMDGTDNSNTYNWIDFTYDYTNAPDLAFATDATLSYNSSYPADGIDGNSYPSDDFVSGSIIQASPVPEPPALFLLLLGAAVLGAYAVFERRRTIDSTAAA